ncbi:MAG TPA: TonB-dependent receptor [Bryobacteraceae bacterium]|nr:TonB-dependent receptor [Bryobacteraceae bacterium]
MTSVRIGLFALAALFITPSAWCQNSGSVRGQVTDPSAAVIPGATVTVTGPGAKVKVGSTNQQGSYVIDGLEPGEYKVRVMARGFSVFESTVQVRSGVARTLDAALTVSLDRQEVTVTEQARVDVDPSNNGGALILKATDLDILSDDPDDLASDLQALAGPGAGPNGGQIYIDGFTGGRLPPKESIREIRINQNPFSSEYDKLGFGRIEVFTKPGADKYRAAAFFDYGNSVFNSRNPFAPTKAPFEQRQFGGNISGPLSRRSSFFIDAERRSVDDNGVINAVTLDPGFNIVPYSATVLEPNRRTTISPRIDYQLNPSNTLVGRYSYTQSSRLNGGVGQFALESRAVNSDTTQHTAQLTETAVLSPRAINETRVQFIRNRSNQTGSTAGPSIILPDAFTGGGAPLLFNYTNENRYEVNNSTSFAMGTNSFKFGGRIRGVSQADRSTSNYNGTFTFTSLDRYRTTLLLQQQGLSMAQIQQMGAGPSQFTILAGTPVSDISQYDLGFFAQDDWRVRPNFTLSLGLRYETQNNIGDHRDFAPRIGIAWGLGGGKSRQPKTVLRAGFGLFYDRFSEDLTLSALRLNGITQQQFIVPFPAFFPDIPSIASLEANRVPQAVRKIDSNLRAPYVIQTAIGVDRQLPKNITLSVNYTRTQGVHNLRSRDINAPLPGTFTGPGTGVRPFGPVGDIYLYESSGIFNQNQLLTNVSARFSRKVTLFGYLTIGDAKSDTEGASSFPANQYDLSSEYSRAGFNTRARVFMGGSVTAPLGLRFSPFISASSGRPFNITSGRDLNGDGLFNDRPAFAAPGRPSIHTAWGDFDPNPVAGEEIVPRNYADGPGQFSMNLRVTRTFSFGDRAEATRPAANGGGGGESSFGGRGPGSRGPGGDRGGPGFGGGFHGPGGGGPHGGHGGPGGIFGDSGGGKKYNLSISVSARNIFNRENFGLPIGNLSSPLFGRSNSLASFFGPGGGGSAGNRRVELQLRFSF